VATAKDSTSSNIIWAGRI